MTLESEIDSLTAAMKLSPVEALMIYKDAGAEIHRGVEGMPGGIMLKNFTIEDRLVSLRAANSKRQHTSTMVEVPKAPTPAPDATKAAQPAPAKATKPAPTITVGEMAGLTAAMASDPQIGAALAELGMSKTDLLQACAGFGIKGPAGYLAMLEATRAHRARESARQPLATGTKQEPVARQPLEGTASAPSKCQTTPTTPAEFVAGLNNFTDPAARGRFYQTHAPKFHL